MNILAIETSGRSGSVAVLSVEHVQSGISADGGSWEINYLASKPLDTKLKTTAALIPMIQELQAAAPFDLKALDLIAVSQGPGSFTGLRIGVTTAKTLAFALGCKICGVNTLRALAASYQPENPSFEKLVPCIDAQRDEVFVQTYASANGTLKPVDDVRIEPKDRLFDLLDERTLAIGSDQRIVDFIRQQNRDAVLLQPAPEVVGYLAMEIVNSEKPSTAGNPFELMPHYHRKSAAEEKVQFTSKPDNS